jgi:arginine exporter protein ArgO
MNNKMDKRGIGSGGILGWIFLSFLGVTILCGFISHNLCDRLLIAVGIFGLICLFFAKSMLTTMHTGGFIFFLFLTFISLIMWIVFTATEACINFPNMINNLISFK